MNKRDLIREISRRAKIKEPEVSEIIYALIKNIEKGLSRREKVNIRYFGTFKLYFRKKFSSALPGGSSTNLQARHIVKFVPGKKLRAEIDPSFPKKITPKKKSLFGFLGKLGFGKKQEPVPEPKQPSKEDVGQKNAPPAENKEKEERVVIPIEKVKMQDENVKVEETSTPPPNPPVESDVKPKPEITRTPPTEPPVRPKPQPPAPPAMEPNEPEQKKEVPNNLPPPQKKSAEKSSKSKLINLKDKKISKKTLTIIPEYIARLYQAVPVEEKGDKLVVAMQNPDDLQAIEFIKKKINRNVIVVGAAEEDIKSVLDRYSGVEAEIEKALAGSQFVKRVRKKRKKEKELIYEEAPTSKIVKSLLTRAVRSSASDIHIEPREFDVNIRFRIDGILQNVTSLPKSIKDAVIAKIKILSNLKIDETRLPQDGRFKVNVDEKEIDLRISTFPAVYGEKVVMRILDKSHGILSLEELGLRGNGFKLVEENIHKSHGMTLVTGPTGSGKTTTLYAAIDRLNNTGLNIITLEDPVEYQIQGVNQGQINPKIGFTFASGLRSILRQDPDVVMIGEIRDFETAEMAVHAALTGHIVLSTLHTNDASGALPRLIDMHVEPFLIVSALNTVIAQRLVRKICLNCLEEINLSELIMKEIKLQLEALPEEEKSKIDLKNPKFYKGKGCESCSKTGYKGRIGLFEVLAMSQNIQEATLAKKGSSVIEKAAREEGMISLKQDGILKALDKITSIEEVFRVTKD